MWHSNRRRCARCRKLGCYMIQAQFHARTAFWPRLGVGFHHSPCLGVAGKPTSTPDRAILMLEHECSVEPSPTPRQTQVTTWFRRGSVRHLKVQHDQLNPRPRLAIVIRSLLEVYDGLRLCVDYQQLGKAVIRDKCMLLRVDQLVGPVIKSCIFLKGHSSDSAGTDLNGANGMRSLQMLVWIKRKVKLVGCVISRGDVYVYQTNKEVVLGRKAQLQASSDFKTSVQQAQANDQDFPEMVSCIGKDN
ncbi:hypothetical protein PIB30_053903 [Stylosanthes scabra]|uniref:Uncharacterized protein n=1 Tax=Stylosanthes scabra TaxID=79078 RepID=A0ABU6XGE2_9FABA|nr:hypothetical protein [Stylosanthes scabra]